MGVGEAVQTKYIFRLVIRDTDVHENDERYQLDATIMIYYHK